MFHLFHGCLLSYFQLTSKTIAMGKMHVFAEISITSAFITAIRRDVYKRWKWKNIIWDSRSLCYMGGEYMKVRDQRNPKESQALLSVMRMEYVPLSLESIMGSLVFSWSIEKNMWLNREKQKWRLEYNCERTLKYHIWEYFNKVCPHALPSKSSSPPLSSQLIYSSLNPMSTGVMYCKIGTPSEAENDEN